MHLIKPVSCIKGESERNHVKCVVDTEKKGKDVIVHMLNAMLESVL